MTFTYPQTYQLNPVVAYGICGQSAPRITSMVSVTQSAAYLSCYTPVATTIQYVAWYVCGI